MIDLAYIDRVYLFHGVTDFRKGISGLYRLVLDSFQKNDMKNSLFLFCNKKRDSIKILEVLDTGIWLYQKDYLVVSFRIQKSIDKQLLLQMSLRLSSAG